MSEELAGAIAYQLTKRMVIDMPTARAEVDRVLSATSIPHDHMAAVIVQMSLGKLPPKEPQ
jgi:hypothetical protein